MEVEKASDSLHHRSSCRDEDEVILPGFRFHPTDEELVGFYLRRKVEKKPISIELIKQIDIYKYDPWDLPRISSTVGDKEMYFFCMRGRKYRNSIRPNRVTGSGFWKATGIDKPIYSVAGGRHNECIGLKKSLVYYRGNAGKGTKTDWMMHEFRLPLHAKNSTDHHHHLPSADDNTNALEAEVWTLCRIFKRNISFKKYIPTERQNPNKHITCDRNSSSITDNFELFDNYGHQCLSRGGDSMGYQMNLMSQVVPFVPTVSPNSSSWCTKEDEIFEDKNWDELQSVVDLAINDTTSHCYRYR